MSSPASDPSFQPATEMARLAYQLGLSNLSPAEKALTYEVLSQSARILDQYLLAALPAEASSGRVGPYYWPPEYDLSVPEETKCQCGHPYLCHFDKHHRLAVCLDCPCESFRPKSP